MADDIDAIEEEKQELEALIEVSTNPAQGIKEISAEKNSLMKNSASGIHREIKVKGQKLGTVISYKYLGAVVSDNDSLKDCTNHWSSYKAETIEER